MRRLLPSSLLPRRSFLVPSLWSLVSSLQSLVSDFSSFQKDGIVVHAYPRRLKGIHQRVRIGISHRHAADDDPFTADTKLAPDDVRIARDGCLRAGVKSTGAGAEHDRL